MCAKWEDKGEESIIGYINSNYSGAWGNWKLYNVPPGIPTHNNGIEGINGAFKNNGTNRERSDLGTFTNAIMEWLKVESNNADPLPTEPLVPPTTWRDAQLLEQGQNSRVDHIVKAVLPIRTAKLQQRLPHLQDAMLMPSHGVIQSLSAPTAMAKKQQLLGLAIKFVNYLADPGSATTFNQLLNTWGSFYVLTPVEQPRGHIIHYQCSCSTYWRSFQCAHSLALGIRFKNVAIPDDRSLKALGTKKRSRGGRYAKAKPALVRQDEPQLDTDHVQHAGTAFACSQADDPCCFVCGLRRSNARNRIVYCDGCDMGFHQRCVFPVLKTIPTGSWYCSKECNDMSGNGTEVEH